MNSAERAGLRPKGNVPTLRFPEFSGEWKTIRLEDCVFFLDEQRKPVKSSERHAKKGIYPYYGASGIIDYVDEYLFDDDLILLSEDGANIIDRNYRISFISKGKVWVNNHAHVLKPKPYYSIDFISEFLESLNYSIYNTGTTMPKLNQEVCRGIKVKVPSLTEQSKIGKMLTLMNERIEAQIRIIEKLQSLMKGITNRIIEDLISNAESVPFSEIYQMAGEGGTPDTTKTQYYEEGTIPFIKIDDLSSKYLTKNKDFITEQGLQKSSAWIIPENSLIYSNGATIGAASINTYKVATKQGILGIVPKSMISVEYLFYLVTSTFFDSQVHRIITHGTMATAYLKDINNIKVPLPCMNEQRRIVTGLASLSDKIEIEQGILFNLQKQKRFLLCKLFI